jgi:alpha-L-fucosidase
MSFTAAAASLETRWKMFDRRVGMFIHWGVYSVAGRHSQIQWRDRMTRTDYEKLVGRFTAEKFDADAFVDVAKSAGADYIVFTSKHHDGFCMWDTATTDYKVTNAPARRDVLAELAAACRRRGLKLGLYYSNPDWHHPNAHNPKSSHQMPAQPGDSPDMDKYEEYVKAQVTELLTNYGEIVCFFWDISTKICRPEMDALVRRLQPGIMINDRGWENNTTCDYSTPERDWKWDVPSGKHVEACDSVGEVSWAYRCNEDYRTIGYLTRRMDMFLAGGGNFLLNVGPKPDGTIPDEAQKLMAGVGDWRHRVGDAFKDVEIAKDVLQPSSPLLATRRGDSLFIHFPGGMNSTGFYLHEIDIVPLHATLLNTGAALKVELDAHPRMGPASNKKTLHVWGIPADAVANECAVVRLDFPSGRN